MMSRWVPLAAGFLAILASAAMARGDMAGTAHDFASKGWSGGRTCTVCHTPHGADIAGVKGAPLWGHKTTSASYALYSSPTLRAQPGQPTHFGSKLCLSCHDGTVALDSFGGAAGSAYMTGARLVGTDLRGNHPIGFVYDSALASVDKGLCNPDTKTTALGNTITRDLLFGTGNLECASCHDVHNAASAGNSHLLRVTADGSALCLTCHNK
jgi:predicted CXXCH cytochrome family protein